MRYKRSKSSLSTLISLLFCHEKENKYYDFCLAIYMYMLKRGDLFLPGLSHIKSVKALQC